MDCKARGRRCPEAGKDPVAVEAVEAAVAPGRGAAMADGSCGRGAHSSEARGPLSMLHAPGQRWERLGAWSGDCGRSTLASKVRGEKQSEERGC